MQAIALRKSSDDITKRYEPAEGMFSFLVSIRCHTLLTKRTYLLLALGLQGMVLRKSSDDIKKR